MPWWIVAGSRARVAIGVADGDVRGRRVVLLVDGEDPWRREAVDRGQHRRLDELAVRQREEVEAVVDEVELVRALEHLGDVQALAHLRVDVRILRLSSRHDRLRAVPRCLRIASGEQRDVDAALDEPFGEQRGELLPRAVVAGRDAPGDRRQHGHAEHSVGQPTGPARVAPSRSSWRLGRRPSGI